MATMDYDRASKYVFDDTLLSVGESNYSRKIISSSGVSLGSGSLRLSFFVAGRTEQVSQIKVRTGSTGAAATPTIVRLAVFQVDDATGDLTLVASTPNDLTLLVATDTAYTKALSAPFTKYKGTRYAVGVLVVTAFATPTVVGTNSVPASEAFMAPHMCAYSAQADIPSTITDASLTSGASNIYFVLLP